MSDSHPRMIYAYDEVDRVRDALDFAVGTLISAGGEFIAFSYTIQSPPWWSVSTYEPYLQFVREGNILRIEVSAPNEDLGDPLPDSVVDELAVLGFVPRGNFQKRMTIPSKIDDSERRLLHAGIVDDAVAVVCDIFECPLDAELDSQWLD